MSHYRELNVNGKLYLYNIGRVYLEIRDGNNKKVIPKADVGFKCGKNIISTPKMVKDYIENGAVSKITEYFRQCDCDSEDKTLTINPFFLNVYDKSYHVILCNECYNNIAEDI